MDQESGSIEPTQKKSKKSLLWIIGGCGCLIVVIAAIVLVVFALRSIRNQELSGSKNASQKSESTGKLSKNEMIDYFVDTAFYDEDTYQAQKLNRWTDPEVTIGFNGDPSQAAIDTVDQFIRNFNSISTSVQLSRTKGNGDISINWGASNISSAGKTGYGQNPDGSILAASVYMGDIASTDDSAMFALLSHEMYHALGFHHYSGADCRLMKAKTCGYDPYSENEKRLIEMMYSSGVPLGADESTIRTFFANWTPSKT